MTSAREIRGPRGDGGSPCVGSPFRVLVTPGRACAPMCVAHGLERQLVAGEERACRVEARDQFGNACEVGVLPKENYPKRGCAELHQYSPFALHATWMRSQAKRAR